MGHKIGMPSLKLSNVQGKAGKHCGNFRSVAEEALSERFGHDLDIDKAQTTTNEYLTEITSADALRKISASWIDAYNERVDRTNLKIKEITEKASNASHTKISEKQALTRYNQIMAAHGLSPLKRGRHIREDATVMCATVIKPPAEYMSQLTKGQQRQLLLDAYEKLCEIVGRKNMKAAVIHFDELNPHLHTFWMPITPDRRLCAKEMHGLKFFGRLNREMPEFLRQHGWDIADCHAYDAEEEQKLREEMGDAAYRKHKQEQRTKRGRESTVFKHEAQAEVDALTVQRNELEVQRDELQASVRSLDREQNSLRTSVQAFAGQQERLQSTINALSDQEKEQQQQVSVVKKEISDLRKQLEELKQRILDWRIPEPPQMPKQPTHERIQDSKEQWIANAIEKERVSIFDRRRRSAELEMEYDRRVAEWNTYDENYAHYRNEYTIWSERRDTIQGLQIMQSTLQSERDAFEQGLRLRTSAEETRLSQQVRQLQEKIGTLQEEIRCLQSQNAKTVEQTEHRIRAQYDEQIEQLERIVNIYSEKTGIRPDDLMQQHRPFLPRR
jgi:peptidoglycan hydrolase CwlO-like protein